MSPKKSHPIWATGRRKTAVASVRLVPNGEGKVTINSKPVDQYFRGQDHQKRDVLAPIKLVDAAGKFDFVIKVVGGGVSGQAGAARHAIARVLVKLEEKNRKAMRAEGFLTRDPRMVERKKSGQPKARKRFQYSKR
ncbi:MAG: 30S ribosomal protein S9 [Elusimicrobia bacterium]|nr:30S ribosomal protein S9 [Elusimicrobiota bacterium]MDE2237587.1 30S ribosomal protein S9 [Elusimicrobiota bacterium]MDE2426476.1 30S ribosomal protein S9 [Elusimicrobiota bacterium]